MSDQQKFRFMKVQVGSVETDPTQWDQFNTDELTAAEAVMRESHQNSLDAAASGVPVRTRISIHDADPKDAPFFKTLFEPLIPHLRVCGARFVPADTGNPRFLVVEDFGTTGLKGRWDKSDDLNFSDFWRRFGNSHKGGSSGGSWGLGKLAYPATSISRTFFGVTIREGEDQPLLMGQTVLQHHDVDGKRYVPFGFYSTLDSEGLQLPILDREFVTQFSRAVGFRRTTEPGLSIAVPFVPQDLNEATLIPALLRNYFFPILTGRLEIEIGGVTIKRDTFGDVVKDYGGEEFADGSLESFIRSLHETLQDDAPAAEFPDNWIYGKIEDALSSEVLADLRQKLSKGDMVHVRVPLRVRTANAKYRKGVVDVAFRLGGDGQKPRGLFVRNAITINGEARKQYRDKMAFAALVAAEGAPAQVLRASENPAHTEWNPRAQKLAEDWDADDAAKRVRQIRRLPGQLCDLLVQAVEQKDDNALIDFFAIPDKGPRKGPAPPPFPPKPDIDVVRSPPAFSVHRKGNGFVIKGNAASDPPSLRLSAAYDVVRGNPFKGFSELDFDFRAAGAGGIELNADGAELDVVSPNMLDITPTNPEFTVEVTGFDTRRDLRIAVRRIAS
ncbi:MAG: hypothetical protein JWO82_3943 [Akkermansiaceae bacterium]|nr:hypothetical protein [Akkermansiaceae bacterium]